MAAWVAGHPLRGDVSDLPALSTFGRVGDAHGGKPSPGRDRASSVPGPGGDVGVGPDLAGLQNGYRLRKPRARDELHDAGLAYTEHVDQFGP